ncbi:hypothetical protein Leryth_019237 [Lithospermum erythrorhizon]|nr:hypothetical protein Leryth_019237 [Lithospermum erythrorhizon]
MLALVLNAVAIGSYSLARLASTERSSAPLAVKSSLSIVYAGIILENLDITISEVSISLDDNLFGERFSKHLSACNRQVYFTSEHSLEKNKVARPNGSLLKEKSAGLLNTRNLLWTCTVSAPRDDFRIGLKEISVCSLFSATDIAVRWEPDVHIALVELGLHLKSLTSKYKVEGLSNVVDLNTVKNDEQNEMVSGSGTIEKQKKRESIFAVDVEMLRISAEVGDGVESLIQVQSIFSENAQIGVLLEGILFDLNDARILKSSRMQISRVPNTANNVLTAKSEMSRTWDWVIQALDVHICMPYRLQLRAIDDSIEEMLRAVKLIVAAKTQSIFPIKKGSDKPKKSSSSRVGCLRFCIRKLAVEIEEEPLQGWLDEHYQLLKNEACELAVRFKFLDDLMPKSRADMNELSNFVYNGEEIDPRNPLAIKALQDEIYKESFRSYYQACRNLKPSEGSGACKVGFQAGFKPSTNRTSILSLSATEFDVTLTRIEGGEAGMIEVVQQLDPVSRAHNIPFARLYGGNLKLNTGSLVVQLRNYTYPLFSGTSGKCEGRLVLAQQATCFQPQIHQDVYVGKWRKVRMLRSASGTTPPVKTYLDLPLHFEKGEICYGVGFEPLFTDISYSFTVALRRANLSTRNLNPDPLPPKKEKSLPWWDEMRNYIHGNTTLFFSETRWNILATTDPYEKSNKLQIISGPMEIQQSDGRVHTVAKDFRVFLSSLESLLKSSGLKPVAGFSIVFLEVPMLTVEVTMDWECDSGNPLNHYLFALPNEGKTSQKIYDPFRSTSLSLRWNLSLRPSVPSDDDQSRAYAFSTIMSENEAIASPTMNCGPQDLAWIIRFWNLNYNPPNKLRTFSRWPRFGVPRVARSGNLSLDKVMTEFMFRVDSTPACIRHMPLDDDDPAKGLTFKMNKLKYEMYLSRGKQKFTFECKRELLDFVYQGVDLHMPKAFIDRCHCPSVAKLVHVNKASHSTQVDGEKSSCGSGSERPRDDGFLLSSEYFTIRRQAPKADPERLLAWQEAGRRNIELTYVRSEFENGSESDEHARSDPSDDDGYNVVIADNCQRIFVYGLKLLWTLENRDAVWSWVGGLSKAFEPSKPSPSRQNAQRKLRKKEVSDNLPLDDNQKALFTSHTRKPSLPQVDDSSKLQSSPSKPAKVESSSSSRTAKLIKFDETEGEGTRHFMVNVIEPQFNLHSEEANGRFLLAAVSGRVLARSFPSVHQVGKEVPESHPEMTWNCMEFSVMLEHVQAHVAPTDVDPGAGLQWLPKIRRSSPKVKRTGALLERVFMPCDMYFRYTRRKGGTSDPKVKPLKELTFNSHNITATMTSRQFQVMLDVLTNLLFARLPKPRRNSLAFSAEDDEDVEEEADEVVPDGVKEVESKRIELEQSDWGQKLILDDIRKLSLCTGSYINHNLENDSNLWMITGGRPLLIRKLKKELARAKVSRRAASSDLRKALQEAAQLRLSEKEKNKNPYAMRISLQINKVVWGMLVDGKSFAEAEISDMTYDFDTDYQDVGVARFTTKYFVVRNCLPSAKSDMLLSAWNPPPEWGKKVMLRVDAKQGAPKDGNSPLELFEVEIYPLKIHLTEIMYRMMWEYFFPEEEQDSQRRQEVWKVSTTAGLKRIKKGSSSHESLVLSSQSAKDYEVFTKSSTSGLTDSSQVPKLPNLKESMVSGSKPELRRTSSFDRTWEETVAESVANELVLQAHSSSSKSSSFACLELPDEPYESKSKESKPLKPGRTSHEEKKVGKTHYDKKSRPRRMREFHNIKISQVELLVTYEGSRFAVSDLRLLMDTFHRVEFVGTWRRLFSRVKKHIIWGVLKSVTGMQLTITKTKRLIRRHTKKFCSRGHKGSSSQQRESLPSSPRETLDDSNSSSGSSPYEDFLSTNPTE